MRESYGKRLATHTGLKSCEVIREGGVEALTGGGAGRALSCERTLLRDADAVKGSGRQHRVHRYREVYPSPAQSKTPSTYPNTSRGNREILRLPRTEDVLGRIGKSEDVRR